MNGLLPIIRRVRRPLLPVEAVAEVQPVAVPVVPEPVACCVESGVAALDGVPPAGPAVTAGAVKPRRAKGGKDAHA